MYKDISLLIKQNLTSWPSGYETKILEDSSTRKGDFYNNSILKMSLQTATHINSPSFYVNNSKNIDEIDINDLCGKCILIRDISKFDISNINDDIKILIIDTGSYINSSLGIPTEIEFDFIRQAKLKGLKAVGFDSLLVNFNGIEEHEHVLPIVNGLVVDKIEEGLHNIIILPLFITNVKSSPARAILEL